MAIGVPPPEPEHATGTRTPVLLQLLPPSLSGEDPGASAAPALFVPTGLHRHGAVPDPRDDRRVLDVLLHTGCRLGVWRHAASQDRRRLRAIGSQRPPLVR